MAKPRRLPPLNALRTLEALQQTGSVTGAAQRLNVSHSAVSHQVRLLEEWAAVPIFVRRGRVTLLTEAGQSLAAVAHRAFDTIRHEIDRLPMRGHRVVTVSALPAIATTVIVPNLSHVVRHHPDISLHLSLAHADRPTSPAPDIEILFSRRSAMLAQDRVFLPGDAVPVCTPGLLATYGGDRDRVILSGPLIQDEDLRMWPTWFAKTGQTRNADPADRHLIIEGSALLQAAAPSGIGTAFARRALIMDELRDGRLVELSQTAIDDDWCYVLRIETMRDDNPDVRAIAAFLGNLAGAIGNASRIAPTA